LSSRTQVWTKVDDFYERKLRNVEHLSFSASCGEHNAQLVALKLDSHRAAPGYEACRRFAVNPIEHWP
jgi:hypothetical protein